MANLKYISRFIIFGQTRGIKWTMPIDFLAKRKQLSFFEGLRPIAASIKQGLLLLRSTIVLDCRRRSPPRHGGAGKFAAAPPHCTVHIQYIYLPIILLPTVWTVNNVDPHPSSQKGMD